MRGNEGRRARSGATLGLAAALATGGCAAVDAGGEERAIRGLMTEQAEAWSRGDLDGFLAGYIADPPVRFVGARGEIRGVETVREAYEGRYGRGASLGALTFDLEEVRLLSASDAFVYGTYHLVRDSGTSDGYFTLLLRRTPGGWRIVHDHSSEPAAPPPPSATPEPAKGSAPAGPP